MRIMLEIKTRVDKDAIVLALVNSGYTVALEFIKDDNIFDSQSYWRVYAEKEAG